MIPDTLDRWTNVAVHALLARHGLESDRVEFKLQLPRDPKGKLRLRRTCAALANSGGGFLLFGIDDDRMKDVFARMVGLEPELDFAQHFSPFPGECTPSVDWDFLNPPIQTPTGTVIHVVQIHAGWRPPYGVRIRDGAYEFDKRTSGGNERMSYEEIAMKFQHEQDRVRKVELLLSEVRLMASQAKNAPHGEPLMEHFQLEVVESLLPAVFPVIQREEGLVESLFELRSEVRKSNHLLRHGVSILLPEYSQASA